MRNERIEWGNNGSRSLPDSYHSEFHFQFDLDVHFFEYLFFDFCFFPTFFSNRLLHFIRLLYIVLMCLRNRVIEIGSVLPFFFHLYCVCESTVFHLYSPKATH